MSLGGGEANSLVFWWKRMLGLSFIYLFYRRTAWVVDVFYSSFSSTKFMSYQHGVDVEPERCATPQQTLFYMNTHGEHRATWLGGSAPGLIDLKSELMAEGVDTGADWGLHNCLWNQKRLNWGIGFAFVLGFFLFRLSCIIRLYEINSRLFVVITIFFRSFFFLWTLLKLVFRLG